MTTSKHITKTVAKPTSKAPTPAASKSSSGETQAKRDVTRLMTAIVDGLEDVKAQDIVVFDTEHLSSLQRARCGARGGLFQATHRR
jgi:hypothetical protein